MNAANPHLFHPDSGTYSFADGRLGVDLDNRVAIIDGLPKSNLGRLGFGLLRAFAANPETPLSIEDLKHEIGSPGSKDQIVRVALSRLRGTMPPDLGDPDSGAIRTERRAGYYRGVVSLDDAKRWDKNDDISVFADERVKVNRDKKLLRADELLHSRIPLAQFSLFETLGDQPNRIFDAKKLYGLVAEPKDPAKFAKNWQTAIKVIVYRSRDILGAQLGDPDKGAIRTVRGIGFVAVESLADNYPQWSPAL